MKTTSINDIKKNLLSLEPHELTTLCLRLAKYKKENKELLAYLLFDSADEQAYIDTVNESIKDMFSEIIPNTSYKYTKQVRKILRFANKQIKYSGNPATLIEILIYFCETLQPKMLKYKITALENIYAQQLKKINTALGKLHEDLQYDYIKKIEALL